MAKLKFSTIGINNITKDSSIRFVCSTNDGRSIYIGSESPTKGDVFQYYKGSWKRITANLTNTLTSSNFKSISSLLIKGNTLFASTGGRFEENAGGQVWKTKNGVWVSTNLTSATGGSSATNLRKLVKVGDDIYTGGSSNAGSFVYKYSNNSWTKVIDNSVLPDLFRRFWVDFESDDTNLYGFSLDIGKGSSFYGVSKYNQGTSSWDELSNPSFGENSNLSIKLKWYNGYLYAATYNYALGTQIYKILSDGSYTQINTNGFGSTNNYDIASMAVIRGNLVVATENHLGSEVWAYNEIEGWEKQVTNSKVRYSSFLIESVADGNFLIGKEIVNIITDTPTTYATFADKLSKDVPMWPEGSIGALPLEFNNYRFFGANNKHTMTSEGPLSDPLQSVEQTNIVSSYSLSSMLPYPVTGIAAINSNATAIPFEFIETPNPGAWVDAFNFDATSTDVFAHFPGGKVLYPAEYEWRDLYPILNLLGYTKYFNALHTGIIPKGINRGKVFMMNSQVVTISSTLFDPPSVPWSCQSWSIYDPSPDAGTPQKPRFLNYLLPICSGEYVTISSVGYDEQTRSISTYTAPNLFCAGHAWDHDGNLIVAGGTRWFFANPNFTSVGAGGYTGDRRTYCWNPASLQASWKSGSLSGGPENDVFKYCPEGHYASAGSWIRGPDLKEDRWYPTVTYHPKISRTNDYPHALIFGGSDEYQFAAPYRNYVPQYDNYESLVLSGGVTQTNCGYYLDSSAGTYVFKGPSPDTDTVYEVSGTYDNGTSAILNSQVPRGSFYFYPRTYVLSGGAITFAGMTDESAILPDHSASAGIWFTSLGGLRTGEGIAGPHNEAFQQYNSSVRLPNDGHNVDRFYRLGGENVFLGVSFSELFQKENTAREVGYLDASVSTNQWQIAPSMEYRRSNFNTVLLPDATVFAVGGIETLSAALIPTYNFGAVEATGISLQDFIVRNSPAVFYDHHAGSGAYNFGDLEDTTHHDEHMIEDFQQFYDLAPIYESGDPTNLPQGGIQYHAFPEVLNKEGTQWTTYDWAPHQSWRDYHSASILLPDGRVLLSGGERRHSLLNGRLYGKTEGYDFEIFAPKYLRPTQNEVDSYPRPTGVGISGATYNPAQDVDCFELEYGEEYILSSNFIRTGVALDKVVFMSPGIVTHHADTTQRYYACSSVVVSDTQLRFRLPTNIFELPPGFYMLFAVTDQDVPAEAIWIKLLRP